MRPHRVWCVGEVFAGRYELLEPIAMGGMGTVWCVVDKFDDQVKAAKILRQSDAASLLRFVREQSMRIDHLHVVTPQSWAGMDDRVLFTMPLVRGGSVAGLVKEYGALPVRWVVQLVDQTLQALEAVHAAGIVHRDVKPANLLLEPTGRGRPHLRLTDFGIAAPLDEPRMTRASMVIGSPGYMAPEQWRGADPDFRSDLYSVGVVGVELLTGTRPSSDSPGIDTTALRTGDPSHDTLLELLAEAMSPDPLARPESASRMRTDLDALHLGEVPPQPGEDISVRDGFAEIPLAAEVATRESASSTRVESHTTRVESDATRALGQGAPTSVQVSEPGQSERQGSRLVALVLIVLGLLGLAVGAFLVFI